MNDWHGYADEPARMIRVESLTKSYGPNRAIDNLTFSVARGEVLVLNDNFCVRVNEIVDAVAADKA